MQFNDYDDSVLDDLKTNDYADIEVPGELDKDFEKEIVVSNPLAVAPLAAAPLAAAPPSEACRVIY